MKTGATPLMSMSVEVMWTKEDLDLIAFAAIEMSGGVDVDTHDRLLELWAKAWVCLNGEQAV